MMESDQAELWVRQAQQGDALAIPRLLAALYPTLRARIDSRMDFALRATTEPDDILQQVYLQIMREIARFEDRGTGSFVSWAQTILDHKLIDAWRRAHRQVRDIARQMPLAGPASQSTYWNLLSQIHNGGDTPSRELRRDEAIGALHTCISGLSDVYRQVIHLRYLEQLSLAEVAARLGKSEAAVVELSRRALGALRKSLDRLGEFTRG